MLMAVPTMAFLSCCAPHTSGVSLGVPLHCADVVAFPASDGQSFRGVPEAPAILDEHYPYNSLTVGASLVTLIDQ